MENIIVNYPQGKRKICIPTEAKYHRSGVFKRIKKGGVWEKKITKMIYNDTKEGSIAIDIGAHIGTHSISMLDALSNTGFLICFEPQTKLAECLNITLKRIDDNFKVFNTLVSNKNSTSKFMSDGTGGSRIPIKDGRYNKNWNESIIETITLDSLTYSKPISVIKIDVEGHEFQVLEGGEQTIKTHKPIIYIEVWNKLSSRSKLIDWCYDNNYCIISLGRNDYKLIPLKQIL